MLEVADPAGEKLLPRRREAFAEAELPVALGRGALEPGDVGDPLVAERHEQIGQRPAARAVVGRHAAEARIVLIAVEEHDRNAEGLALLGEHRGHRHRGQHDAVDLIVEDLLEDALDVSDGRRGHEDQDVVALLLQRDRQALHHLGIEVVLEIGDHEADDPAAPGDQRPGQNIRAIAQFGGRAADLLDRVLGGRSAGREDARHRRLADPGPSSRRRAM